MGALRDAVARMIRPLQARVMLMVGRAVIHATQDAKRAHLLQLSLLKGEVRSDVEQLIAYGFTSRVNPPDAAGDPEAVVVCVGGNRDHMIAVATEDRRYRPKGTMVVGDVVVYDSAGTRVHLQPSAKRLVIEVAQVDPAGEVQIIAGTVNIDCDNADINASERVQHVSPLTRIVGDLDVTGDVTALKDTDPFSMEGMRDTYNIHTHPENDNGGPTSPPNQLI